MSTTCPICGRPCEGKSDAEGAQAFRCDRDGDFGITAAAMAMLDGLRDNGFSRRYGGLAKRALGWAAFTKKPGAPPQINEKHVTLVIKGF